MQVTVTGQFSLYAPLRYVRVWKFRFIRS